MDATELRGVRERLELSVDELAPELNVEPTMLRRWEAGQARVPRSRLDDLRRVLARLEREQDERHSRRRARPRRPRVSRLVFVVPVLLLVASIIGRLPAADAWVLVLFPAAIAVAGVLAVNVDRGLPWLRRAGPLGGWMARCASVSSAMLGFVGTFAAAGYTDVLSDGVKVPAATAVLLALASGCAVATFWFAADALLARR